MFLFAWMLLFPVSIFFQSCRDIVNLLVQFHYQHAFKLVFLDLGLNCLQMLSGDNISPRQQGKSLLPKSHVLDHKSINLDQEKNA